MCVFVSALPSKVSRMKILFINNDGGFADYLELPDGTTVMQLFQQRMVRARAQDYLIRVNRQPTAADAELHEGDRVSMTPVKIEGASGRVVEG